MEQTRALLRPFTAPRRLDDLDSTTFHSADSLLSLTAPSSRDARKEEKLPSLREMTPTRPTEFVQPMQASEPESSGPLKRKRSGLSRREQCRMNQARYRNKQRNLQLSLEQGVQELHKELNTLKQRRRDLTSREKISHSPWTIVAETFNLLQTSFRSPWRMENLREMAKHADFRHSLAFLKESLMHDVAMGDVVGASALLEQVRRYSLYFGEPQIKLNRIEEAAPGIMKAVAQLSVTVTEFSLRHVFPHLEKLSGSRGEDESSSLREKLVGSRLSCKCSMSFLFDEDCGRVSRLEVSVDWLAALTGVLESVEDASVACGNGSFSSACILGEAPRIPEDPQKPVGQREK